MNAAIAPGMAKRITTPQSAFLPTRKTLKILLARCTTAVAAIAIGTEKNRAKAGMSTVPRPKPENNVSADTSTATRQTTIYSIFTSQSGLIAYYVHQLATLMHSILN